MVLGSARRGARRGNCLLAATCLLVLTCACSSLVSPRQRSSADQPLVLEVWLPNAVTVQVIGDWNLWGGSAGPGGLPDPSVDRMERLDDGSWVLRIDPGQGRHRYAFLVDGWRWLPDPGNPETVLYMGREVSVMVIER